MKKQHTTLSPLFAILMATPASAVINFTLVTDGTSGSPGNITTPGVSWTGNGLVQGGIDSHISGGQGDIVLGFSGSGSFMNLPLTPSGAGADRLDPGNVQNYANMTYELTPADPTMAHSADLFALNTSANGFKSLVIGNMVNVASFTMCAYYDEPIAPQGSDQAPWGLGVRQMNSTNVTSTEVHNDYDITMTVGAIQEVTSLSPLTVNSGIPSSYTAINRHGGSFNPGLFNTTLSVSGDSFTTSATIADNTSTGGTNDHLTWNALRGLDTNGNGSFQTGNDNNGVLNGDAERVYAQEFCFTITADGGVFDSDQEFGSSFEGRQYFDTIIPPVAIPEPSSLLLLSMAYLSGISRRKR